MVWNDLKKERQLVEAEGYYNSQIKGKNKWSNKQKPWERLSIGLISNILLKIPEEFIKNNIIRCQRLWFSLSGIVPSYLHFHQTCLEILIQDVLTLNLWWEIAVDYKLSRCKGFITRCWGDTFHFQTNMNIWEEQIRNSAWIFSY